MQNVGWLGVEGRTRAGARRLALSSPHRSPTPPPPPPLLGSWSAPSPPFLPCLFIFCAPRPSPPSCTWGTPSCCPMAPPHPLIPLNPKQFKNALNMHKNSPASPRPSPPSCRSGTPSSGRWRRTRRAARRSTWPCGRGAAVYMEGDGGVALLVCVVRSGVALGVCCGAFRRRAAAASLASP